jgi:threonyl-tRNA synthetase
MENQEISVRKRGGDDLGSMSIEAFVKLATEG